MSPSNPEVALYTEATVRELIQKYGVEGIHLDCLAYSDLDYDYSKSNVKAFAASRGLPADMTQSDLLGKEYAQWLNWRSSMIAAYASKIGSSVRKAGRGKVEYSAAFAGNRVFNYKDVDQSGQEISLIAPSFDFIVPVMHVACLEGEGEMLARSLVSLRVKSGAMPFVVRLIGPADGGMMTETIFQKYSKFFPMEQAVLDFHPITPFSGKIRPGGASMKRGSISSTRRSAARGLKLVLKH